MKKISYDKKSDALYLYLASGKKKVTETREVCDGIIADYAGNEIVGIEILDASKILGAKLGFKSPSHPISYAHKIKP